MILDAVTKSIEIDLGEAHTTNALPVTVDYVDLTTTTTTAGSSDTASNGTTAVTIVAAPAASTQRKVNFISVQNADTVSHVTTIQLNNNTTLRNIVKVTLQVGETLQFTDVSGWSVLTTAGTIKEGVGTASEITFTPAGMIAATTVQAAIEEVDSEHAKLAGDTAQDFAVNDLAASGGILSSSPATGVGYASGAGGAVTQLTDKTTGVTLNTTTGRITTVNSALGANATATFTLTNSSIVGSDILMLTHFSGGALGSYSFQHRCTSGSATICIRNVTAGSLSDAVVIGFAVIKGAVV